MLKAELSFVVVFLVSDLKVSHAQLKSEMFKQK